MTEQAHTGGHMASVKRLDAERDRLRLTAWRTDNPWPTARKG